MFTLLRSTCSPLLIVLAGELHIEIASDPQVTPAAAVTQASQRFEATLLAELVRREPQLSTTILLRELPRLWMASQADRQEQTDELLKPYGKLYRRRVTWSLSDLALRDWLNEQRFLERSRSHAILIAVGLTIAGWLLGLGAMLKWDRATGGYRRPMIVGVIVLLLLVITAGGWWTLLAETGSITTNFV